MKNLLIATTALVATAGVAAADVSLSGAANVGVINNGATGADTFMYNNVSVTAAMSGETDGGLTFGSSLTFRSGDDVDLDVGDITNGGALGATSLGNIYVSGDFGKLTFDNGGIDNAHNDGYSHDVMYEGTFGAVSVTVTADLDGADQGTAAVAAAAAVADAAGVQGTNAVTEVVAAPAKDGNDYSIKLSYSANGLTLTGATDDSSEYDVTAAYAINDMLTASVNYDSNGQTVASVAKSETIVKVAYSNAGVTAHLAIADDKDDAWELGLGYAANGMSIAAVLAENDGAGDMESDITASYDLGGGMTINAATNESGAFFIGSKMSF